MQTTQCPNCKHSISIPIEAIKKEIQDSFFAQTTSIKLETKALEKKLDGLIQMIKPLVKK